MASPFFNHIILADDDKDHGILFHRILRQVDASKELIIIHDGETLIQTLEQIIPEILFLDLKMPCKHGFECLQEIRNNPELQGLKVVVYSSSTQMNDIQKSYLHKANLYMVKPFKSEHLRNALETILKKDSWREAYLENHYFINNRFVPFTAAI